MNPYSSYALSKRGTSHFNNGTPCQDASAVLTCDKSTVIAVADGLGSKKQSATGSKLAVRFVCKAFKNDWFASSRELLLATQSHLLKFAKKIGLSDPNELATTLQVAIISENKADFCICGDGAIVYSKDGEHLLITDKQEYELANQTFHLLSDGLEDKINTLVIEETVLHVSSFTDGMRAVLINEQEKVAHPPIFDYLINYTIENDAKEAVQQLVNSPQVTNVVDDDRSLAVYVLSR